MRLEKELKDLNLMDRFLFSEAIEDQEFFEGILKIILGEEVLLKLLPQAEKEKRASLLGKHIKLDVYSVDEYGNVYNAEVQKKNTHNLPRRTRFYNSIIDSKLLPPGTIDYNELKNVFIIMISPFDLFNQGLYRYTFSMSCEEDPNVKLNDGVTRIFLNTRGTNPNGVSEELINLLKYFENTTSETAEKSSSDLIHMMHKKIDTIKMSDEIGVKYMNAWEEKILDKQEAREEGLAEGLAEGLIKGELNGITKTALKMKEDNLPIETISRYTGLSIKEINDL